MTNSTLTNNGTMNYSASATPNISLTSGINLDWNNGTINKADNFRRHRRLLQEASLGLRIHFEHTTTDRPLLECIKLLLSRR
jgi:hypothetical protein